LLPKRLTKIDETTRDEYCFLSPDDDCYFFGDFYSRKGWGCGDTNQLITNYKRTPEEIRFSANAKQLQYYKKKAISEVADALRGAISPQTVENATFVPIPTSRVRGHPDYCDRLERTLRLAFCDSLDLRFILRQIVSTKADHRSGGARSSYDTLLQITDVDPETLVHPVRKRIILFDDVLTSGKHYKVARTKIGEVVPGHPLIAVFVARAIHSNPYDDFENLDA